MEMKMLLQVVNLRASHNLEGLENLKKVDLDLAAEIKLQVTSHPQNLCSEFRALLPQKNHQLHQPQVCLVRLAFLLIKTRFFLLLEIET